VGVTPDRRRGAPCAVLVVVVVPMNREAWRGAIAPLMERAVHHSEQRKTPKQSSFRTPVRATVDYELLHVLRCRFKDFA